MSHRVSVTVLHDDQWYNVPSVSPFDGRPIQEGRELDFAIENDLLGQPFDSLEEAERFAVLESQEAGSFGIFTDSMSPEKFEEHGINPGFTGVPLDRDVLLRGVGRK